VCPWVHDVLRAGRSGCHSGASRVCPWVYDVLRAGRGGCHSGASTVCPWAYDVLRAGRGGCHSGAQQHTCGHPGVGGGGLRTSGHVPSGRCAGVPAHGLALECVGGLRMDKLLGVQESLHIDKHVLIRSILLPHPRLCRCLPC